MRVTKASPDKSNCNPKTGANNTNGKPETNQCASIFAPTNRGIAIGDKAICSKVPSRKSASNKRCKASIEESKAPTHKTPGAILRNTVNSGPIPSGNKAATTTKKNTALNPSLLRRHASNTSRRTTAQYACHIMLPPFEQSGYPQDAHWSSIAPQPGGWCRATYRLVAHGLPVSLANYSMNAYPRLQRAHRAPTT